MVPGEAPQTDSLVWEEVSILNATSGLYFEASQLFLSAGPVVFASGKALQSTGGSPLESPSAQGV